jgi:HemY protein
MAIQEGRKNEALELYKRAHKVDADFVPATVRVIQSMIDEGKRHKAMSLLEKSWKNNPHPAFLPLWKLLVPEQKAGQPNAKFRWFQWIAEFHPTSEVAYLALARAAIEEEMWGEARAALAKAEKLGQSAEIYQLWVTLEEKTTNRPDVIRQWLDRAYHAPTGGVWVCTKTGRSFAEWQPVVEPEGAFNTLVWDKNGTQNNRQSLSSSIAGVLATSS